MNIEQRLAKLETEARRWRRFAICQAVAVAGLTATLGSKAIRPDAARAAEAQPATAVNELRTKRLYVVNDDGKVAVDIYGTRDGCQALFDSVGPNGDGGAISLSSGGGHASIHLGNRKMGADLTEFGMTLSKTVTQNGQAVAAPAAYFATSEKGRAFLSFSDPDSQKPIIELSTGDSGGGMMEVYNALGTEVATIQAGKANQGLVGVADLNGKLWNYLSPR